LGRVSTEWHKNRRGVENERSLWHSFFGRLIFCEPVVALRFITTSISRRIKIMKRTFQTASLSGLIFILFIGVSSAIADQVIYVAVNEFIPADSQFGVDVDGNTWIKTDDADVLVRAFGDPGDNDRDAAKPPGAPFLVLRLPEPVEGGESTADGREWVPWARMRVKTDKNSFFWQVSTDKVNWKPADNDSPNRWNDDSRNAGQPNGDGKWYWQDNVTGNDGGIPADMAVGVNYVRIGTRESGPDDFPEIDVVCFRNDGGTPNDSEALTALASRGVAVEPAGKLATTWGTLKREF
jgi:hypothetical protein